MKATASVAMFLSAFRPFLGAAPEEDLYRHAGLSPEEAARAMTLPEGFQVTLFAGEPDVQQPIGFALDDRGRLWVAECYSYPHRLADDKARDRILIFEDRDGDGRFDARKVFAEKLNLLSGIEVGFGGVWAGAAPHFLFIPDRDGDDVPDGPPQVLLDGWGHQDTHETLNAFTWGPDGWLYGCHGVFTHSKVGKPGAPDGERRRINAGIWRYHPTRHLFEIFCHGTSNPWGIDFDDRGQAFLTACVIPHLYHVIQGARYERQGGQHFNPYTYDDLKTIADHRHWMGTNPHGGNNRSDAAGGGHAHCGAMVYLGGSWPAEYRDSILFSNIHGQRVNRDLLEPRGSGFVGRHGPDFLLANDRWSQILNLKYGPDGQVYLIDWYDRQACHTTEDKLVDRANGRIFKVAYKDGAAYAPALKGLDLKARSDADLVQLQLERNDWYVRHARRVLSERAAAGRLAPETRTALRKIAFEHRDETRRLRGLWALHGTGGLSEAETLRALADPSPHARGWAVQLALEGGSAPAAVLERLAVMARDDPSPVARLYLASGLERLPHQARWPILDGLLGHREDAGDHNLPLLLWYALEPLAEREPARALEAAARSRLPLHLAYTARRIASRGDEGGLALLVKALGTIDAPAAQTRLLEGVNAAFEGRREAPKPAQWQAVFDAIERGGDPAARAEALKLAVKFRDERALAAMRAVAGDGAAELDRRRSAVASLLGVRDPGLLPILRSLLGEPALRGEALRGLAAYDDAGTPDAILAVYGSLSLPQKRDALATLASRAAHARALLGAIAARRIPESDLPAELVRQMRNLGDGEVKARIDRIWGVVGETDREKAWVIGQLKRRLTEPSAPRPDLSRGRAVFQKSCEQCHTLFGAGGKVGPELTGSNRADLDYLLSNVLDPGALIGKDYLAHVVQTRDGRVLMGLVREAEGEALKVITANETVVLPRKEVRSQVESSLSMMPDDLLKTLRPDEVRALFAYLASPVQAPALATPDNLKSFFNGKDLAGWEGDPALWSVEGGEIVGRSPGLKRDEFLRGDLLLGDFRLSLEVKLVPDGEHSGIQFRSASLPGGGVKGYQADIGKGWWGKLHEEHGRGLLWQEPGEGAVKPGKWNRYEIVAVGSRIRTSLNGKPCADLDDPAGARRGIIALRLHPGGPMEVRFRGLELELDPESP